MSLELEAGIFFFHDFTSLIGMVDIRWGIMLQLKVWRH